MKNYAFYFLTKLMQIEIQKSYHVFYETLLDNVPSNVPYLRRVIMFFLLYYNTWHACYACCLKVCSTFSNFFPFWNAVLIWVMFKNTNFWGVMTKNTHFQNI